jgi:23S rRNA (adenine1618-N6)-methyltransferase
VIRGAAKAGFHPRNRFRSGYDFRRLALGNPSLRRFVRPNEHGDDSIDFADPAAVKALNAALLADAYGIHGWDLPPGALCPGVPGRSDQIHHVADLLAESAGGNVPRGPSVRILDLCTGASCILPLVGSAEHEWSFVASDADAGSLRWARRNAQALGDRVDFRLQPSPLHCFRGIVREGERFHAVTCNPPFYESAAEAGAATRRKVRNLQGATSAARRNFGGRAAELWCEGGELGFVQRMIRESAAMRDSFLWITTLVSRSKNLDPLQRALSAARAVEVRVIPLAHGQKKTRLLAWSFLSGEQRRAWSPERHPR